MEVLGSIYTGVTADFQRGVYPIARCVKAEQHDLGVVMADVNVLGSLEAKFESTNRIYDVGGVQSDIEYNARWQPRAKILEAKQLGFMDNGTGKHQSNTVYDENALCPNITTVEGGGTQQIKVCESQIVAMRGRNPYNPSDRTFGSPTEQIRKAYEIGQIQESRHNMTELEPRQDNVSNTLTTVQKDNLLLEKPQYRIRKLTPRECGRLMGVSDEDIDKMAAVNSNTQLYKQFGNSIVVDVMCAMFRNLNIKNRD